MERHDHTRRKNECRGRVESEAQKRQENCTDPRRFLRATRETVVDKRRARSAVINYETFAAARNSHEKMYYLVYMYIYIYPISRGSCPCPGALRQEDRRTFRIVNRIQTF